MAIAQRTPRKLDKDLSPEELQKKMAPVLADVDLQSGESSQAVIEDFLSQLPTDKAESIHVMWIHDGDEEKRAHKAMGYEQCKYTKGSKAVRFKTDILMSLDKDRYDRRMLRGAWNAKKRVQDVKIEEKDAAVMQGEEVEE